MKDSHVPPCDGWDVVSTMNRFPSLCLTLGLAAAPAFALAQGGESLEPDQRTPSQAGATASAAEQRSALWMAVDAVHRQRDAAAPAPDRRLTAEQRQQLREQLRRAWPRPEGEATATSAQWGQR